MAEESTSSTTQEAIPQITVDATPAEESGKTTKEEATEFLKEMQEKAGQISECSKEEENLVKEFLDSLLKILKPFRKTLDISVSSLPERYNGRISKAHLYLTGQLVLVCNDGEVEILNLADKENHEILVEITGEIMVNLKSIIDSYKSKTEKRVKFLLPITKELQKVAKVFSEE
ncbi:hypothetical protein KAU92_00355 [Candidatus Bathyarchaeota archaeon]|nr:hypothetical protein [Candidatus Bathyarchaeota archaeon]